MPYADSDRRREYNRQWMVAYRVSNPEESRAPLRRWQGKNPDYRRKRYQGDENTRIRDLLAQNQATGEAVEGRNIRKVEGMERTEHVERGGRRLDLRVDRHRDGADGGDVLALDVGQLAAPGALDADHR